MNDFYRDEVMLRRVKRAQARDTKVDVDYDDDDDGDGEEGDTESQGGGEGNTTLDITQAAGIKPEGGRDRGRRARESIDDD